jgi:hypothetical protein
MCHSAIPPDPFGSHGEAAAGPARLDDDRSIRGGRRKAAMTIGVRRVGLFSGAAAAGRRGAGLLQLHRLLTTREERELTCARTY